MSLLKYLMVGAAAAAGYSYITKKRVDGTSIADDLKAKAPEWMDKAKPYMDKAKPYIDQIKDKMAGKTHESQGSAGRESFSSQGTNF